MTDQQLQVILSLFDISIALLIFGVGLPSLIFDRPAYLRRIRERHSKISKYASLITTIILTTIVTCLGAYLLDPHLLSWFTEPSCSMKFSLCRFWNWILQLFDEPATLLIIISVYLTVWVWVVLRTYRFHYVLKRLEKELRGVSLSARAGRILKHLSPRFSLDRPSRFDSLGVLGQNAATQDDKKAVLVTLERIRIKAPFSFNTDIEETKGFVEAVLATLEDANADNHHLGIEILSNLAIEVGKDKNNNQLPIIVDGLTRLGTREWGSEALQIHQHLLATFRTLKLFEQCQLLCIAAINRKQYGAASGFIQYLDHETYTLLRNGGTPDNLDDDGNPIIHYIGAIANAMAVAGELSDWAKDRLSQSFNGDQSKINTWCDRAINYYLHQQADFDTAHHIRQRIKSS